MNERQTREWSERMKRNGEKKRGTDHMKAS